MPANREEGRTSRRIVVAGLLGVLSVVVVGNSWGTFTTDIKPEVYLAPGAMLGDYLSAWTFSPYLGGPNFNTGLAPVVAVLGLLSGLGLSPEPLFKVFHLALWVVAAAGARTLVRTLDPRVGWVGGLAAAIVYVANPYAVTAGSTLAVLLPMAFLPWQLICLVKAMAEPRSWRWPALFGLTFFAMSGINVAVVPVLGLVAVVPVAMWGLSAHGLRPRDVVRVVGRCALFVVWVSLYWLVPSVSAVRAGSAVVESSETLAGIAQVSSFAEVLRGLGLWPLYGASDGRPWLYEHAAYIDSMPVVVATFVAAALGVLAIGAASWRLRRLLAALLGTAAVIMVGVHPPDSPSPFGHALRAVFEAAPVTAAFRTTNKVGAVMVVAVAVGVGVWAHRHWSGSRPGPRAGAVGAVGVLLVLVTLPVWRGDLYVSDLEIPSYWDQAAASVDSGYDESRVAVLPGVVLPSYRWSVERPDDIVNSLVRRPTYTPVRTPNTSPPAFNLSTAFDDVFQRGNAAPRSVSTYLHYLGATDLLLRHDLDWESSGGARPSGTQRTVNADPGLVPVRNFGDPGQNVGSPVVAADGFAETEVPPLQQYRLAEPSPIVRATPVRGQLLVGGDGWSLDAMTRAGLLTTYPALRYAQDLEGADAGRALRAAGRLVITDTNRRRDPIPNRLVSGQGPLLRATDDLASTAVTIGDPEEQTVLEVEGGTVTASQRGYTFFDTPWGAAENAFDGDPSTAWVFGDFGNALDQHLDLRLDVPRAAGEVVITQALLGPQQIDRVRVDAGAVSRSARFGADGTLRVDLGDEPVDGLRVTVETLRGDGFNAVGLSEVAVDGVMVRRVARTPLTMNRLLRQLDGADRAAFGRTPLDVLLTREQAGPGRDDDEEAGLERVVTLPDARTFRGSADVKLAAEREDLYDLVSGASVEASSSGRYFDSPAVRASRAFDGNRSTGWVPDDADDAFLSVAGPERELPTLGFEQRTLPGATSTRWATRVRVLSGNEVVAESDVSPGRNDLDLTDDGVAPEVGDLRLELDFEPAKDSDSPPRIVEVGAALPTDDVEPQCLDVLSLDGDPVPMRPVDAAEPGGSRWRACDRSLEMDAGRHTIRSLDRDVVVDSLDLIDRLAPVRSERTAVPALDIDRGFGGSMTVTSRPAPGGEPFHLTIGEGVDERWRAHADGVDLGPPVTLDGYAAGWVVDGSEARTIEIRYSPQRSANLGLAASGLGLLTIIGVASAPALARLPQPDRLGPARSRLGSWRRRLRGASARVSTALGGRLRSMLPARAPRTDDAERPHRRPPLVGWVLFVLGAGFFASWPGGVAAAVLAGWHLAHAPARRTLLLLAASLLLLAGLVFVGAMGDLRGTVTPRLVSDHPWPNRLAAVGLVCAIVALWRRGPDAGRSADE